MSKKWPHSIHRTFHHGDRHPAMTGESPHSRSLTQSNHEKNRLESVFKLPGLDFVKPPEIEPEVAPDRTRHCPPEEVTLDSFIAHGYSRLHLEGRLEFTVPAFSAPKFTLDSIKKILPILEITPDLCLGTELFLKSILEIVPGRPEHRVLSEQIQGSQILDPVESIRTRQRGICGQLGLPEEAGQSRQDRPDDHEESGRDLKSSMSPESLLHVLPTVLRNHEPVWT